jgi:putative aminopeptidase FrvX
MPDTKPDHPALSLLRELLSVPSPSGREERLAEIVRRHLTDMGYEPETDPAGNVLVRLPGAKPDAPLMILAAHLDEIGMVVTNIESDGSLRVDRSGGLFPYKIGEGPVEVVGDGDTVIGVLSVGSAHTRDAGDKVVKWQDVRILTGLSPEELAKAGVRPGSAAVPVREFRGPFVFGNPSDPLVAAWTFDDRAGVVALLRLLGALKERGIVPLRPTMVAFTVHEEGGCHGAKVLAHREKPEVFIAIDGCPMPPEAGLKLDGRPGTWSKDSKLHYDQRLVQALCEAAKAAGTELQVAVYSSAASDASAVYDSGGAPRVAVVGHVRENSHGYEVAQLSVFDNLLKTLLKFVETWK